MIKTLQLKGGIYEVNFGYNAKRGVYACELELFTNSDKSL